MKLEGNKVTYDMLSLFLWKLGSLSYYEHFSSIIDMCEI